MNDLEHAELSLSSSERWVNCPGSIMLGRNIVKAPPGSEAVRGTKVHELCAVALTDFLEHKRSGTDPTARLSLMSANYEPEELQNAEAYCTTIWEEILQESITGKAWGVEERLVMDKHLEIWGTCDFWAVYLDDKAKRVAAIVDYKNGFNLVEAKSGQLKSYACAFRREVRSAGKDIDYVRVAVFQPRCPGADAFRVANLTSKALDVWERKMLKAAHQIYVKQKPLFKVGDYCKWCPAKAVCKKFAKHIETETALKIVEPEEVVLPAPETITPEQLSRIVLNAEKVKKFFEDCQKYALNLHLSGQKLPGLKAVLGSTRRGWIEDEEHVASELLGLGLQGEDIYQKPKLATLTSIEKKLGKGRLNNLTKESTAKPVLVPTADPRVELKDGLSLLSEIEPEET